jgi:hypothetical protein
VEVADVIERNSCGFPCGEIENGRRPIPGRFAPRRDQAPVSDAIMIDHVAQGQRTRDTNLLLGSAIERNANQPRVGRLSYFDEQTLASWFHANEVAGALAADFAVCGHSPNTSCRRAVECFPVRRGGHLFDAARFDFPVLSGWSPFTLSNSLPMLRRQTLPPRMLWAFLTLTFSSGGNGIARSMRWLRATRCQGCSERRGFTRLASGSCLRKFVLGVAPRARPRLRPRR